VDQAQAARFAYGVLVEIEHAAVRLVVFALEHGSACFVAGAAADLFLYHGRWMVAYGFHSFDGLLTVQLPIIDIIIGALILQPIKHPVIL